ncbi:ABC transporter permease [Lacihabitans soyangensis]|uniref:ABC transporter permease n=1 Tax=Lacihabitans soyangensis TaxID=869394 RepID=A0AAE3GZV9_9BACT|nr:ABC transporter permease [Lacihabitans soyangensis]MCP9762313.1 ABC transporter permease [Lacihabitans soyangensis]
MKIFNNRVLYPILTAFILVLLWQFVPSIFDIPNYVFPRFSEVFTAIFLQNTDWLNYLLITSKEAILGFMLGSLFGFLVGVVMAEFKTISLIALPYVIASNAIPVIAIAPIIILWFGNGILSKIVVSAFLCFFPLSINTYRGLTTYPKAYAELFNVYGGTKWDFLTKFKLFNARPFIFSGLKLSATFSVIGSIVGEIIASDSGLGYGMLQSVYSLNMPRLWGYVLLSCFLGILAYVLIIVIEKYSFKLSKS